MNEPSGRSNGFLQRRCLPTIRAVPSLFTIYDVKRLYSLYFSVKLACVDIRIIRGISVVQFSNKDLKARSSKRQCPMTQQAFLRTQLWESASY
jgi:hypothetical protein